MTDLVSVVLPTRDRAEDVVRAATSVLSQDLEALELVVVNDSSTDDTARVLDELAGRDDRVHVVETEAPLGPCEARNRGLAVARGEIVGFCDDDDRWLPGIGSALTAFLDARPELAMVSSWHVVEHAATGRSAVFRGPLRFGTEALLWQNVVGLPFALIRRGALSFEVGFDPALPTGEDWDLFLRCAQERPVCTVPHVGYLYTQHGGTRVTRSADAQAVGRRGFLAKHGAAMSSACRLYHQAVLAGYDGGRPAMAGALRAGAVSHPVGAGCAALVLAASLGAHRVGQRRGDPGLQARVMARLVSPRGAPRGR
ncbi:MAG TPA: glycosyltransferase family A protein [Acidimicrobiales bacterium]|nr:glycosyltransferase family A protein [Acidimicrobiales bacterium]